MTITRTSLADEIDAIDESIAALNASKSEAYGAYRDQMELAGFDKDNIKLEIQATKAAIKRRRAVAKDEAAVEEKDALTEEIFVEISAPRATRTREAA